MPTPRVGDMAHGKAHRMHGLKEEFIEAVWRAGYLDEQPLLLVAHDENTAPDADVESVLVEQSDTHDAALERRDDVDVRERPVITPFVGEDDGPAPVDLHHGSVREPHLPGD